MSDLKKIKEQIEKLAQVPTRSKGPKSPTTTVAPTPTSKSVNQTNNISKNNVNTNVINMQKAIQELARTVIRDSTSSTMPIKTRDTIADIGSDNVQKSKKSFNDFIAEQYIGNLDDSLKGVEWSTDHKNTNLQDKGKTQTDIYELDAVMNTLNRIGGEKTELIADGHWEFRTDNALRNILGFAYSLLQLQGDFGLSNTTYTSANWKNFKDLLSDYTVKDNKVLLTPQQKNEKAAKIIPHLNSISRLYEQFRKQVTARPEFRPFIEGQRGFDKYKAKTSISPNEVAQAKSDEVGITINYTNPLNNKKINIVPLAALVNKNEYLSWMKNVAGLDETSAVKLFNEVIKPKVEAS